MEKVTVSYKQRVVDNLNKKVHQLYKDEWFGFIEDAQNYVNKIYDYIDYKLPYAIHKKSTPKNKKFGQYYTYYKANKSTTWFIFLIEKGTAL